MKWWEIKKKREYNDEDEVSEADKPIKDSEERQETNAKTEEHRRKTQADQE